jgi:hypothetical protein
MLLVLSADNLSAQTYGQKVSQLSIEDGLSLRRVNSMLQLSWGHMGFETGEASIGEVGSMEMEVKS